MKRLIWSAIVIVLGAVVTTPALAGIADSPLPTLVTGKKTLHLYSVPGVISAGDLVTYFYCTSTDSAAFQVGVEVFGSAGGAPLNDAATTSVSVFPGGTVGFVTNYFNSSEINFSSNLGTGVGYGSARIIATSKKLVCTAFVADGSNAPPATSWQLTIIKKLTEKGD